MTERRNLEKELQYFTYTDMEGGNDTQNIHYPALIGLLGELIDRVETLEKELEYQKEYAMEQNERYG
jgi:heme oxygenase